MIRLVLMFILLSSGLAFAQTSKSIDYALSFTVGSAIGNKVEEENNNFKDYIDKRNEMENKPKYLSIDFRILYPVNNTLGLQSGISLSTVNISADTVAINVANPVAESRVSKSDYVHYYFIDIPLTLRANFLSKGIVLYGLLGPEINVFFRDEINTNYRRLDKEYEEETNSNDILTRKPVCFSGVVGVGIEWFSPRTKALGIFIQPTIKQVFSSIWQQDVNEHFGFFNIGFGIKYAPGRKSI